MGRSNYLIFWSEDECEVAIIVKETDPEDPNKYKKMITGLEGPVYHKILFQ